MKLSFDSTHYIGNQLEKYYVHPYLHLSNPNNQRPPSLPSIPISSLSQTHRPRIVAIQTRQFDSQKVAAIVSQVLEEKQKLTEQKLNNIWDRYNPIMISGDLFTVLYLGLEGTSLLVPKLTMLAGMSWSFLLLGEISGIINIGVACISLKEGIQAFANGDQLLGWRMLFDFVFTLAIGVIMILASTAIKVSFLAPIATFFAVNPWLLPVLFFITALPCIIELCQREKKIFSHTDMGSQIMKNIQLNNSTLPQAFQIAANSEETLMNEVIKKMEDFQAEIGVEAALAAFRVWLNLLKKEQVELNTNLRELKNRITEWNCSIHARTAQQILFTLGFILSLGALRGPYANTINAADNFSMALANGIPLYTDTFWPFRRNTPIVVPFVDVKTLNKSDEALAANG